MRLYSSVSHLQVLADQVEKLAAGRPVEGIIGVIGRGRVEDNIRVAASMACSHGMIQVYKVDGAGYGLGPRHVSQSSSHMDIE